MAAEFENWIWWGVPEHGIERAQLDYDTYIGKQYPVLTVKRVPDGALGCPVFVTSSSSSKFENRRCPPVSNGIVIDKTFVEIILSFENKEFVQFYPIKIKAGGIYVNDYFFIFVNTHVNCIDYQSMGEEKIVYFDENPIVMEARQFKHLKGCLGGRHIARECLHPSHLIVSNDLKNALVATGEPLDFRQPEQVAWPPLLCRPLG
ncbi:MAG: hypothetical protein O9322_01645 [Beijerinckiaceae bacterium]|nr:hypothetical protein [Beijerinckiaceae bacterium]MCZ8301967.1 hypothetical protein [Beijerinckiaceae bacterium]